MLGNPDAFVELVVFLIFSPIVFARADAGGFEGKQAAGNDGAICCFDLFLAASDPKFVPACEPVVGLGLGLGLGFFLANIRSGIRVCL